MEILLDPYRTPPSKLTSTPYPIITEEWLYSFVNPVRGDIFTWEPLSLTCTGDLVEGDLRIKFHASRVGDNMKSDAEFLEGSLRTILHIYAVQPEAYTSSIDILSGLLRTILHQYQITPEAVASSAAILEGTLT